MIRRMQGWNSQRLGDSASAHVLMIQLLIDFEYELELRQLSPAEGLAFGS